MNDFQQRIDSKIGPTSPFPFLKKVFLFVLGKEKPDWIIWFYCWIVLLVGLLMTLWYATGTMTFLFLDLIENQKGISANDFLQEKALIYGFSVATFKEALFTFQAISGGLWTLVVISLIAVYWGKVWGMRIQLILLSLLLAFQLFYLGWTYFFEEIAMTDKVLTGGVLIFSLVLFRRFKPKARFEEDLEVSDHADQNLPE